MNTKKAPPERYERVEVIKVSVWNQSVGALALDDRYGYYSFAYDPKFAKRRLELSPLQMPLSRAGNPYYFPDLAVATFKRLPAMIADALPDDFGNALITRYMAEQGIPASAVSVLDRLAYMGKRTMGALQFEPAQGPKTSHPSVIDMRDLVDAARQAVSGHFDDDGHTSAALRSIIDVGTSAGGARAKAVIAWNPSTQEMQPGQFDAPAGFEHWLLKFDGMGTDNELGATQDYGRIEYAYHLMAREAGIQMMDCRLLEENGRAHFMTARFDREGASRRHHMQTLCAMAHVDYKLKGTNSYAQLFTTINALGLPSEARTEAFRRMAFNIAAKNCDDHSKNFSFLLKQDADAWELAPAYDVTFAHNPQGEWTSQHLMSVNGKFRNIDQSDLLALADRFIVPSPLDILEQVDNALKNWPIHAQQAGLGETITQQIGSHHTQISV